MSAGPFPATTGRWRLYGGWVEGEGARRSGRGALSGKLRRAARAAAGGRTAFGQRVRSALVAAPALALAAALLGAVGVALPGALAAQDRAGPSAVAAAAARGDLEAVRELLRDGADVNAPQGDGMTALHWAAERGDGALAGILLWAGARVDAGTRIGSYTPLHLAARAASEAVVAQLLEAGADPRARTTNSGVEPLHLAAAAGDPGVVRALIAGGADVNGREGAWDQTPLTFAAAANRVAAIEALLEAGADVGAASRSVDVSEWEKADAAAERRIDQFLESFREREGGGPGWQPTPSQVQAAIEASREIQRRWPDVPDPADDGTGEGAGTGEEEAGQESGPPGQEPEPGGEGEGEEAGVATEADESGGVAATPDAAAPHEAALADSAAASAAGTGADSAAPPRPPSYGQLVGAWGGLAPLHHAVRQGHAASVLALLEGGAEIDQPSGDGTTPLLMAAVNGQFDLALALLDRGADPNLAGASGATPLFVVLERQWAPRASYSHPTEHLRQRATYLETLAALLDAGADPNARLTTHLWYMEYTFGVLRGSGINLQGATPFWRAAYALDIDAMRLLSDHGADTSLPTTKPPQRRRRAPAADSAAAEEADPSGLPPIPVGGPAIHPIHAAAGVGYGQSFAGNAHRHVPGNWMAALRFLVEECGADVNARDANGYTPLHHAASRGDSEMVLYLVDRGADVTAVSRRGQTTADMANGPIQRQQPFPETVVLLEALGSKNNHNCLSC